jgi:peptidoglycan hydrolase-like amidase
MKVNLAKLFIFHFLLSLGWFIPPVIYAANESIEITEGSEFPEKININGYYSARWSEIENRCVFDYNSGAKYDVDFNEYLKGVVFVEMAQTSHNGKSGINYPSCLEAQAIAAINKALNNLKNGEIVGTENA